MIHLLHERRTDRRLQKLIKSIREAVVSGDQERSRELASEYGAIIAARFEAVARITAPQNAEGAYSRAEAHTH